MIDFADSDAEDQRPFLAINVSGLGGVQDTVSPQKSRLYRKRDSCIEWCAALTWLLDFQARLFKNVDLDKLEYTTFDGWNQLEPAYNV
jgi:hypothetical protein